MKDQQQQEPQEATQASWLTATNALWVLDVTVWAVAFTVGRKWWAVAVVWTLAMFAIHHFQKKQRPQAR